jgi:hypothetical protein
MKLYQQLVVYVLPIISNIGFIGIVVVVVRLYWFEKRLKTVGKLLTLTDTFDGRNVTDIIKAPRYSDRILEHFVYKTKMRKIPRPTWCRKRVARERHQPMLLVSATITPLGLLTPIKAQMLLQS